MKLQITFTFYLLAIICCTELISSPDIHKQLYEAIVNNNMALLKNILRSNPKIANKRLCLQNGTKIHPLQLAARYRNWKAVTALVCSGANLNSVSSDGNTCEPSLSNHDLDEYINAIENSLPLLQKSNNNSAWNSTHNPAIRPNPTISSNNDPIVTNNNNSMVSAISNHILPAYQNTSWHHWHGQSFDLQGYN